MEQKRNPAASTARTGGTADLVTADENEIEIDREREPPLHPQGAGGIDPSDDADEKAKERSKKRVKRVLW